MSKVELTTASEPLSKYARKARNDPVIVVKDGTPLAAVIPVRNTDEKTAALSTSGKFLKIIERSRSRFKKEGGISAKGIWRRLRIDDQPLSFDVLRIVKTQKFRGSYEHGVCPMTITGTFHEHGSSP